MKTFTFYSVMARAKYQTKGLLIESITFGCSFDLQRALCMKHKLSNQSKKKRRVRFDFNTSAVCTSRIYAKVYEDSHVLVKLCAQHNHPLSPDQFKVQKLPKSRRDFLTNAFVMGASMFINELLSL